MLENIEQGIEKYKEEIRNYLKKYSEIEKRKTTSFRKDGDYVVHLGTTWTYQEWNWRKETRKKLDYIQKFLEISLEENFEIIGKIKRELKI